VKAGIAAAALAVVSSPLLAGCGSDPSPPRPPPPKPLPKVLRIVFPEGFTRAQMVERVDAVREIARVKRHVTMRMTSSTYAAATAAAPIPAPFRADANEQIEGFLFPATYAFFANEQAPRFVGRQLDAFRKAWRKVDMRYARSKNLTPYDVLIIASMIEREVVVPSERRLVAAVIYNRLHARMPLGIDATLRYGLNIPPTEPITLNHLDSDSPYNTRKLAGLPPTPIANPGLPSMQAAAHPAKVDYLYFVRKPDCRSHFFTASSAEFDAYSREGLQCGS
jgi:peptidoglycan lytic transglycosylase G